MSICMHWGSHQAAWSTSYWVRGLVTDSLLSLVITIEVTIYWLSCDCLIVLISFNLHNTPLRQKSISYSYFQDGAVCLRDWSNPAKVRQQAAGRVGTRPSCPCGRGPGPGAVTAAHETWRGLSFTNAWGCYLVLSNATLARYAVTSHQSQQSYSSCGV